MISESIIDEDVWSEAPSDSEEAFLFITMAARAKLNRVSWNSAEARGFTEESWRKQYIVEISTIATELGIDGLPPVKDSVTTAQSMESFDVSLARVITRIRARKRELLRADSVQLSVITKDTIRSEIERLRDFVNRSNLSDEEKTRLHSKIAMVEDEINKKRSSLSPFWILAGSIGAIGATSIGTLADLPAAVQAIESVISHVHQEKAREDNKDTLLGYSALQITHESKGALLGSASPPSNPLLSPPKSPPDP